MQAVHLGRRRPSYRARHRIVPGTRRHPDDLALVLYTLDDEG